MSQIDSVLSSLQAYRQVSITHLTTLATKKSVVTYVSKLRKIGYRIKYLRGTYYYGGISRQI